MRKWIIAVILGLATLVAGGIYYQHSQEQVQEAGDVIKDKLVFMCRVSQGEVYYLTYNKGAAVWRSGLIPKGGDANTVPIHALKHELMAGTVTEKENGLKTWEFFFFKGNAERVFTVRELVGGLWYATVQDAENITPQGYRECEIGTVVFNFAEPNIFVKYKHP